MKNMNELVKEYRRYKRIADEAKAELDKLKPQIIAEMGGENTVIGDDYKVVYRVITSARIDAAKLRREYPENVRFDCAKGAPFYERASTIVRPHQRHFCHAMCPAQHRACCILFIYCQSAALSAVSADCILADSSLFDWAHPSVSPESFDAVRVLRSHSDCLYFGSGIVLQHPLSNLQPSCARLRRLVFLSAGDCYFLFSHPDTIRRSQVFLLFDVLHLLFSCGLCPLGAWTNFLLCIYRAHAVCFADLFAARFILASRHCRIRYPDGMQAIQTNSYLSIVYIRRFLRAQHQILR